MSFLPENYSPPPKAGGSYFRPIKGTANRVRIAGSAIVGWVGWEKTGETPHPVRSRSRDDVAHLGTPDNRVSHFWAFPVIDRSDGRVKIWEVTQATIQETLRSLVEDSDWGDPRHYDIRINRSGDGLETNYTVTPCPKAPSGVTPEQSKVIKSLDIEALYDGDDPFAKCPKQEGSAPDDAVVDEDEGDDIPF